MSSSRTKYALTPRGDGKSDTADLRVLTPRDLRTISKYISANQPLQHRHRVGRIAHLIPPAPFMQVKDTHDDIVMLSLAPVNPRESALDVPLRFAPPSDYHCPAPVDPPTGATLAARLAQFLKGTSVGPAALGQGNVKGRKRTSNTST